MSKLIFILVNKQKAVRQIVGRDDLHFMGFGRYTYIRLQNFVISRILQRVLRSKQSNFLPLKAQFVRNNYLIANQLETLDRLWRIHGIIFSIELSVHVAWQNNSHASRSYNLALSLDIPDSLLDTFQSLQENFDCKHDLKPNLNNG